MATVYHYIKVYRDWHIETATEYEYPACSMTWL